MNSIKDLEEWYSLAQYKEYSLGIDWEINKFIESVKKWKITENKKHTWKNCAEKVSIWKRIDNFFYEQTIKIVEFVQENFFITFLIIIPAFCFVILFLSKYFCSLE